MNRKQTTRAEKIALLCRIAAGKTLITELADPQTYFLHPLENGQWEQYDGTVWTEKQVEARMKSHPKDRFITFNVNVPKTWLFRNDEQTQNSTVIKLPNNINFPV